jgi:hypothetical protein
MNYITINVDRKFLIRTSLVVFLAASHMFVYKHAFNKGMQTAFNYIMEKMGTPAQQQPVIEPHTGSSI